MPAGDFLWHRAVGFHSKACKHFNYISSVSSCLGLVGILTLKIGAVGFSFSGDISRIYADSDKRDD